MEIGRRIALIIIDELQMMNPELEKQIEEYKNNIENEMVYLDSCNQLLEHNFSTLEHRIIGFGRGMSKTSMLAQAMVAYMARECDWEGPDTYGDWRDFIPNPSRSKQKGRAYKATKQSFRAQMRSVNRNR